MKENLLKTIMKSLERIFATITCSWKYDRSKFRRYRGLYQVFEGIMMSAGWNNVSKHQYIIKLEETKQFWEKEKIDRFKREDRLMKK